MSLKYELVEPSHLSEWKLQRICAIEVDMWARDEW